MAVSRLLAPLHFPAFLWAVLPRCPCSYCLVRQVPLGLLTSSACGISSLHSPSSAQGACADSPLWPGPVSELQPVVLTDYGQNPWVFCRLGLEILL